MALATSLALIAMAPVGQRIIDRATPLAQGKNQDTTYLVEKGVEAVREPITDARVVIYGPRGDSVVAASDGATAGVYTVSSATITDGSPGTMPPFVLRLRPGERYRLRVETSLGVVTGETTIPVSAGTDAARRTFNVDRDTLRLAGTARAGGYLLRHETSSGGRERYVATFREPLVFPLAQASTNADDKAWAFEWAREAIRPGHAQNFIVIAVDSNYFRYYVAGFDPFGDDTRGNTLQGGVGLFGSATTLQKMLLAFLFALLGTLLFMKILARIRFKNAVFIALVGLMLGNVIDSVTTFFAYKHDLIQSIGAWFYGDFSMIVSGRYEMMYISIPLIVIAYLYADRFTIAGMGEEFSVNLGLNYRQVVNIGMVIVALVMLLLERQRPPGVSRVAVLHAVGTGLLLAFALGSSPSATAPG